MKSPKNTAVPSQTPTLDLAKQVMGSLITSANMQLSEAEFLAFLASKEKAKIE